MKTLILIFIISLISYLIVGYIQSIIFHESYIHGLIQAIPSVFFFLTISILVNSDKFETKLEI